MCGHRGWRCHVRRQSVLHLRYHHRRLQRPGLCHEGQVQGQLLDRSACRSGHSGTDPGSDPGQGNHRHPAELQPGTDHSLCSGSHRRCHRYQRLCGPAGRYCLRRHHHAGHRPDRCHRSAGKHGFRRFRYVRDLHGCHPGGCPVRSDPRLRRL